ncbi:hypothetical protein JHN59_37540 [Streptomyces sp. MBT49]|uniref:hypothetical protein n=1 Tax=Streptomyces sp. MBT49 TaxID=1488380 RepID=UPI001909AC7E|nr:hypothetical protein [Streptomyces sp. MBT49]MBK3630406.1 hypothetical protein [Streptomyces sp. MBT49]
MSAGEWLLAALAVLLVAAVALGVDDTRRTRRRPARVSQRPPAVPYLPETRTGPWHPDFLLVRGRNVRAARARSRYPQEPPRPRPRPEPTAEALPESRRAA